MTDQAQRSPDPSGCNSKEKHDTCSNQTAHCQVRDLVRSFAEAYYSSLQADQGFDNTNQGEAQVSEFTDNEETGWNFKKN